MKNKLYRWLPYIISLLMISICYLYYQRQVRPILADLGLDQDYKVSQTQKNEKVLFAKAEKEIIPFLDSDVADLLPPLPDPVENDKTLLGVDFNNNWIRDDLERYLIASYFPRLKDAKVRRLLLEFAAFETKADIVASQKETFENEDDWRAEVRYFSILATKQGDCANQEEFDLERSGEIQKQDVWNKTFTIDFYEFFEDTMLRRSNGWNFTSKALNGTLFGGRPDQDPCSSTFEDYEGGTHPGVIEVHKRVQKETGKEYVPPALWKD